MSNFQVPVLMYHALIKQEIDNSISNVHISINSFSKQMAWLAENNYNTLTLDEFLSKYKKSSFGEKDVIITFDDGYLSLLEEATPILFSYGFKATLFLTTFPVGKNSYDVLTDYHKSYPVNDRPLTWHELKLMETKGWSVQAHGDNHLAHNMLSYVLLKKEMYNCMIAIKNNLEKEPHYYSFPYGRYNTRTLKMLSELNLAVGFSVHQGLVTARSDLKRLPRIEISQNDNMITFASKMKTGYANKKAEFRSKLIYNLIYKNTDLKDGIKYLKDLIK